MNLLVKLKAVLILGVIIFFSNRMVWALSLPLPPNTKIIRDEVVDTGSGGDKQVTFCESDLSEEQISSFYRRELERRGYSIFLQQKSLVVYLKGDNLFMVVISAACPTCAKGKTSLVLTETKMEQGSIGKPQACEDIPNVPVYPGAQCMSSMRMKNMQAQSVKYSVPAILEETLGFYRLQMPPNGWRLEQETSLADKIPQEEFSGGQAGVGLSSLEDTRLLVFKNIKDERCTISLMPAFIGKGTLIDVIYEKTKE